MFALLLPFLAATALSISAILPTLDDALAARQDVWGMAAIRQTNGPSYEFFRDLLPPLRYVNANFKYYPIALSAPGALSKGRLTSNGSSLNAPAVLKTWKEVGFPVEFFVGKERVPFGQVFTNLEGPCFLNGYLPVVQLACNCDGQRFEEEAFASCDPELAPGGAILLRFNAPKSSSTEPAPISASFPNSNFIATNHTLVNSNSSTCVAFSDNWTWNAATHSLVSTLDEKHSAFLCASSKPASNQPAVQLTSLVYEKQKHLALETWTAILNSGTQIETPEPLVNNASRAIVCSLFTLLKSNAMNYSFGNAYDRLYQAECGDAARALMLMGHTAEAAPMIPPLLRYTRDALKYHNAGFKLQTLSHYYWLTRDAKFLESTRDLWSAELDKILGGREKDSGMFPKESYCGDINTKVYSLHSNGAGWRGLRDFAAVLKDAQEHAPSKSTPAKTTLQLPANFAPDLLTQTAVDFRKHILAAASHSIFTNVSPPFVPVALYGEEKPTEPLTATMLGSYWDLIAPYMLGSGMFGTGSPQERAILDYLHEHGGVFIGMIRFHQHSGLYANEDAVDDLYGVRYTLKLLEVDNVDRALVSFYGKLAHGLTRETYIGAEGTGLRPQDQFGRPMYLPPNSTAQAYFLWMLRYLLVQDWDTNDDGEPDTLRIAFATPKPWLEDGKTIRVQNAPTAFGPLSFSLRSELKHGRVTAELELPDRNVPAKTVLRIRLPDGWHATEAVSGRNSFKPDSRSTIDITELRRRQKIVFYTSPGSSQ
jgi:hypothetical protein